jgi:hypothetical protein
MVRTYLTLTDCGSSISPKTPFSLFLRTQLPLFPPNQYVGQPAYPNNVSWVRKRRIYHLFAQIEAVRSARTNIRHQRVTTSHISIPINLIHPPLQPVRSVLISSVPHETPKTPSEEGVFGLPAYAVRSSMLQTRSRRWVTAASLLKSPASGGQVSRATILISLETFIGSKQWRTNTHIAGMCLYYNLH